jgi:hypothetical protein
MDKWWLGCAEEGKASTLLIRMEIGTAMTENNTEVFK